MRSVNFRLLLLLLLLVVLFTASLFIGSVSIPISDVLEIISGSRNSYSEIIWTFRLPRALTCLLAGGALSTSGLLMQTLFRNPLAGPDVLGLSAGSGLVVAIVIMASQLVSSFIFANPWIIAIASSTGSALVFLFILLIARFVKENTSLLIIGLMIGATTSSLVGVLQYVSRAEDLQAFMIWGLGNTGSTGYDEILVLGLITFCGLVMAVSMMKSLNGLLLGENYAQSLGIRVKRTRTLVLISASIMTGAVTAFCGPIAFVGIAVPHLVRLVIPVTNHKQLIPGVIIGGAILMLVCDIIAQLPGSTQVLPINAVTSLVGAPIVIWMVIRSKRLRL
jgi:iron complex transport system permease protein